MAIRKTPVCPFCKTEMKHKILSVTQEGVMLITEIKYSQKPETVGHVKELTTMELSVWECECCGYVALWRGNPR